ncbi:hypothetical protein ACQUED_05780 [Lactococcus lactis]|uniref:hypothetical protein n=1 Tax=Lactococcus lactis TaxID=1358 RepID=UPI00288F0C02|nr:hypothetical protein [Lactococcus lactis]MDT2877199.1 hypothetical protein [Lactococcus lactis]MDT2917456.1 hypothetical protein [Lactococcus lactis]
MNDMLNEIMQVLATDSDILSIQKTGGFKSYSRYENLSGSLTSITVIPAGPPEQTAVGSNDSFAKHFVYQVSIEATNRMESKELQRKVENILKTKGFFQMNGGLDEYFEETKRYVDARFYEGNSNLYENY